MIFAAIILGSLATFRVTRFIMEDRVFDAPRGYLFSKNKDKLTYFLTCPWCISIWVGLIFALTYLFFPEIFLIATLSLTFSAVTGILYSKM